MLRNHLQSLANDYYDDLYAKKTVWFLLYFGINLADMTVYLVWHNLNEQIRIASFPIDIILVLFNLPQYCLAESWVGSMLFE